MRETELLGPLVNHFESRGFLTFAEVEVSGRRADLVAISPDGLIAIELKVSRWRQAIRQAVAYQVWAPSAYVALPFAEALRAHRHRETFERDGVGLLAVLDEDIRTFVPASPSPRMFPALAEHIRHQLTPEAVPLEAFVPFTGERF